jgi:hypothetical protein
LRLRANMVRHRHSHHETLPESETALYRYRYIAPIPYHVRTHIPTPARTTGEEEPGHLLRDDSSSTDSPVVYIPKTQEWQLCLLTVVTVVSILLHVIVFGMALETHQATRTRRMDGRYGLPLTSAHSCPGLGLGLVPV